jgi:hypothetical protein
MRRFMMTVTALAAFGAMVVTAQAERRRSRATLHLVHLSYLPVVRLFSWRSRTEYPSYNPRTVSQTSRPPQAVNEPR